MKRALSYWEEQHYYKNNDIAIIGCGIVGLNAGIQLLNLDPSLRVIILERSGIPYGASTRNAGFACFGSPSELMNDLKTFHANEVFSLFRERYTGIQELKNRLSNYDFEYESKGGLEVFSPSRSIESSEIAILNRHIEDYIGIKDYFIFDNNMLKNSGLYEFESAIYTEHEACINPMKMIDALLRLYIHKGGKILFNHEVQSWEEKNETVDLHLITSQKFSVKKLLFTVNGFGQKLFPQLDIKAAQNQVMVIKPSVKLKLSGCYHFDEGFIYFRQVHGKLLIGGGRNQDIETEFTDRMIINEKIKIYLLDFVKSHILPKSDFDIENHWVGILGLGNKKQPIVSMLSDRIGVALRLSGVGIAIGTSVGNKAAEMILHSS